MFLESWDSSYPLGGSFMRNPSCHVPDPVTHEDVSFGFLLDRSNETVIERGFPSRWSLLFTGHRNRFSPPEPFMPGFVLSVLG